MAIIMQDDLLFCDNFKEELEEVINHIPEDAEFVNLGFHKMAVFNKVIPWNLKNQNRDINEHCNIKINEFVGKFNMNPCSSMYIVTLDGAKNFVAHIEEHGVRRATDHEFNRYVFSKGINYCSRLVLATGADLGSDVFPNHNLNKLS